jgi:hypothetical protein
MKDKPTSDQVRELLWRRPLKDAERAEAAKLPEWRAELEVETQLTEALEHLPLVQVSSNFTARVLQAIDREEARPQRRAWQLPWLRWLPRMAVPVVLAAFAVVSWQHHEMNQHRTAIAQSVALVAGTSALPGVEALNNYEVIQRMSQSQHADETLLALMQ